MKNTILKWLWTIRRTILTGKEGSTGNGTYPSENKSTTNTGYSDLDSRMELHD